MFFFSSSLLIPEGIELFDAVFPKRVLGGLLLLLSSLLLETAPISSSSTRKRFKERDYLLKYAYYYGFLYLLLHLALGKRLLIILLTFISKCID